MFERRKIRVERLATIRQVLAHCRAQVAPAVRDNLYLHRPREWLEGAALLRSLERRAQGLRAPARVAHATVGTVAAMHRASRTCARLPATQIKVVSPGAVCSLADLTASVRRLICVPHSILPTALPRERTVHRARVAEARSAFRTFGH